MRHSAALLHLGLGKKEVLWTHPHTPFCKHVYSYTYAAVEIPLQCYYFNQAFAMKRLR